MGKIAHLSIKKLSSPTLKSLIKTARFVKSSAFLKDCPPPVNPEFSFIGRSNVGKSSLINMLTDHKKLAKTSSKPGKTQLINHFLINEQWYLVDLPGYGWAKASKADKEKWGGMTHDYLILRENLQCIFVLIDSRLSPQPIDIEFINWLGAKQLPLALVFTKSDKQSKNKTTASVAKFGKTLKQTWEELPPTFITSAVNQTGKTELVRYIQKICLAANSS